MSPLQISEPTIFFGVFSSFSIWIMDFGRSWSAGTKLSIGLGHQTLVEGTLTSFLHTSPSCFSLLPNLQLEEGAHKMVLLLTSSLIYWLLPRLGHKELVHTVFYPFGGRTVPIGEKTGAADEARSAFGIARTWYQLQPFAASSAVFIKITPLSQRGPQIGINGAWALSLGIFSLSWVIKTVVELHLRLGLGLNCAGHNPFASHVWGFLALCVPNVVGLCCPRRFQITFATGRCSLSGTWVSIPFHSHSGYMFMEKSGWENLFRLSVFKSPFSLNGYTLLLIVRKVQLLCT